MASNKARFVLYFCFLTFGLLAFSQILFLPLSAQTTPQFYRDWVLQVSTALHETDANWKFALGPNRDLYCISTRDTGTHTTEIHVLSAGSNYSQFVLQTGTALHETDGNWAFGVAANGDLVAIHKRDTQSHTTEVHILSASSNYQQFSAHIATCLPETDENWDFALDPNSRDIFAILKRTGASSKLEIHILGGGRMLFMRPYQDFMLHTQTACQEVDENYGIALAPDLEPRRDLFVIQKSGTGTHSTEIHVLSQRSGYLDWALHTGTALHETGNEWEFAIAPNRDLFCIHKNHTPSGRTEVHILFNNIFDPLWHGLHFKNYLVPISELDIPVVSGVASLTSWDGGVCGGLCGVVLNRFNNRQSVPTTSQAPSSGDPLYQEIVNRQKRSLSASIIKRIVDWQMSPDLSPSFPESLWTRHSVGSRTKGQWPDLKNRLDAGKPTTLILIREEGATGNFSRNHQVVAYGYLENQQGNITINIYDPNYPNQEVKLTMNFNLPRNNIDAKQSTGERVRGFFINPNGDSASQ